jgi:hypothetical protein
MSVGAASDTWPTHESDPQRVEILTAADRLLAGAPCRSTGNLSVVQLAIEAGLKYWVVAQRHTDLRDHFQRLAAAASNTAEVSGKADDGQEALRAERDQLRQHCDGLEQIVHTYATIINELSVENEALRDQLSQPGSNVRTLRPHGKPSTSGHRGQRPPHPAGTPRNPQ